MRYLIILFSLFSSLAGCSQNNSQKNISNKDIKVGAGCEGCEAIYESPVPFAQLKNVDTLPDFLENGPKIEISGFIYKRDGKTPAKDVILYVYHTDQTGVYPKKGDEKGWAKRHGFIRGWIKSDETGFYKFFTQIPASYPNSNNPKHIHPTIKEPGLTEYWIDDFIFHDDPLLPASERNKSHPVCGSGVLNPVISDGIYKASRNIILGLNVKDYPKQ